MTTKTTTCEIRNYTTGKVCGEARVDRELYMEYTSQKIGQWPEGIIAADELLMPGEMERLGLEDTDTVWIML